MLAQILQEIQEYTESIEMGQTPELPEVCPRCKNKSVQFKLHDHRKRTFLVVVEMWVKKVLTWLARYKCSLCKKTFTVYPNFALPYKRYVLPSVVKFSEKYVNGDKSYRNCCREGPSRVGYEDGRLLEGTTIWRWVGYVGKMENTLRNTLEIVERKLPGTGVFRAIRDVLPGKYRSEKRKGIIELAWRLLNLYRKYKEIFLRPIFPRFASPG